MRNEGGAVERFDSQLSTDYPPCRDHGTISERRYGKDVIA
jgi:hypothetical protein